MCMKTGDISDVFFLQMDASCSPRQKSPADSTFKRLGYSNMAPLVRNLSTDNCSGFGVMDLKLKCPSDISHV